MTTSSSRRNFLKKSIAAGVAAPLVRSVEEYTLTAQAAQPSATDVPGPAKSALPCGKIGNVTISRLICGGNLISGYAHSRDLIYVSRLLKAYFTEAKIMETWDLCAQHGINTMIFTPNDKKALEIYGKYRARGGRMQCLAQMGPEKEKIAEAVQEAVDVGVVGAVLVGNCGDAWTREGDVARVGQFIDLVKGHGLIAGVAGHELRTHQTVEKAGIKADFYMKTLHTSNYWSQRRPDQLKEVIDNYGVDNYWCLDPEGTIRFMEECEKPWLAYKVLAAGAIPPRAGFQYAFASGADFCVVGMFDFQVAEDVAIATEVLRATETRTRRWYA